MPAIPNYVIGQPGYRTPMTAFYKTVFFTAEKAYLPGGKLIDGAKSRDTDNTSDPDRLQGGLLMGKVTATGAYANWSIGQLTVAYTSGTSMTISTTAATELVRRIGSSGTFVLTGPNVTGLATRQTTVTYSAVNTSTGVITVTGLTGADEIQQISFNGTATAGNIVMNVPKPDGTVQSVTAAWAAGASFLTNINAAIVSAFGSGVWVATGASPSTDLTFTASGSYAGQPIPTLFTVTTLPTGTTSAVIGESQRGVAVPFLAGSVISQNDGTQVPVTFLPDGWPIPVTDGVGSVAQVDFPNFPVAGIIDESNFVGYTAMDVSLQNYVKASLSTILGGKYAFKGNF